MRSKDLITASVRHWFTGPTVCQPCGSTSTHARALAKSVLNFFIGQAHSFLILQLVPGCPQIVADAVATSLMGLLATGWRAWQRRREAKLQAAKEPPALPPAAVSSQGTGPGARATPRPLDMVRTVANDECMINVLHVFAEILGKAVAAVVGAWLQHKLAKRWKAQRRLRAPQLGALPAPQPLRRPRKRGRRAEQTVPV